MAGYMKKLNGHVYDGAHVAGSDGLTNGLFVELNSAGKVVATTAAKDMDLRVVEKTVLWGMPAVIMDVVKQGEDEVYLLENEWEVYEDAGEYNTAEYSVKTGHPCRMHRPLAGEQIIVTVGETLYGTLTVNQIVNPAANGTVA